MDSGYMELQERPCKRAKLDQGEDYGDLLHGLDNVDWSDLDYDLAQEPAILPQDSDDDEGQAELLIEEELPVGSLAGDADVPAEEEEMGVLPATGSFQSGVVLGEEDEMYWGGDLTAQEEEGLFLATQELASSGIAQLLELPSPLPPEVPAEKPLNEYEDDIPLSSGPPVNFANLGFTTGNGLAVRPPSTAALARAQHMMASSPAAPSQQLEDLPSSQLSQNETFYKKPSFANLGFKTAGGKSVAEPSNESFQKAQQLFAPTSSPIVGDAEPIQHSPPQYDFSTMFKTAGGAAVKAPSAAAIQKAEKLLASPQQVADTSADQSADMSHEMESPIINRVLRTQPAPLPSTSMSQQKQPTQPSQRSRHPLAQVQNAESPKSISPDSLSTTHTPVRPTFSTPRIRPNINTITPSPFVPPRSNIFSTSTSTSAPKEKRQINISILPSNRSLLPVLATTSLRSSLPTRVKQQKKFVPPFKGGVRPTKEDLEAIKVKIRERERLAREEEVDLSQGVGARSQAGKTKIRGKAAGRVFDLSSESFFDLFKG